MLRDLVQRLASDIVSLINYIEKHKEHIKHDSLDFPVATRIHEMTASVHERCEMICRVLCALRLDGERTIKRAIGRISAFVFFDVDEFVYAKYPALVPEGLKTGGGYVSMNKSDEIDINALNRLLAEELRRLQYAISMLYGACNA